MDMTLAKTLHGVEFTGFIEQTQLAAALSPEAILTETRSRLAMAITAMIMEKIGPAIEGALTAEVEPAPELTRDEYDE